MSTADTNSMKKTTDNNPTDIDHLLDDLERPNYDTHADAILKEKKFHEPKNTTAAYDPKSQEFVNYCHSLYVEDDDCEVITPDKVFGFMYYQAYRGKKVGKGKKGAFNRLDFDTVMSTSNLESRQRSLGNVVGSDQINQYLCAIRVLLDAQRRQGLITIQRQDLMSDSMKSLVKLVAGRGERVMKENFKERVNGQFQPFKIIDKIPGLEEQFWEHNHKTRAFGAAALRDRFQFLHTLNSVMRSDSLYKAELADLCDFNFHQPREPDPYHIMILRDGSGKQAKDKAQFGKVMRHRLPELCSIGALGLYLLARFDITKEYEKMDFLDNKTWFGIKLLTSASGKEETWSE